MKCFVSDSDCSMRICNKRRPLIIAASDQIFLLSIAALIRGFTVCTDVNGMTYLLIPSNAASFVHLPLSVFCPL